MDTVLLRQRAALAALYILRAARGAIVQGDGRLLLPPLHRKSALRKPARSKKARAYLQAYRLRQSLGGSRPVLDPVPERPYGMKRRTYSRLCMRIERLERPLIGSRLTRRGPILIAPLSY
jgi:hypothetical protein